MSHVVEHYNYSKYIILPFVNKTFYMMNLDWVNINTTFCKKQNIWYDELGMTK